MNKTINVTVKNKIAVQTNDTVYVCGNDDFVIVFDFDDEWDEFTHKTARLIYNGTYVDIVFSGNQCAVPVLSDTYNFVVGVYAGDLRTTTPAYIGATKSILCGTNPPAAPAPDVYSQMVELFNAGLDECRENANVATEARTGSEAARDEAVTAKMVASAAAAQAEKLADQVGVNSGLQADWNVNDSTIPGYVQNRTHWVEYILDEVIAETTANPTYTRIYTPFTLVPGEQYRVIYNGVAYDCPCQYAYNSIYGDSAYLGGVGYPFQLYMTQYADDEFGDFHAWDGAAIMTFAVYHINEVIHPLPSHFMRLTSPDGTVYELTVANDGTLGTTLVTE